MSILFDPTNIKFVEMDFLASSGPRSIQERVKKIHNFSPDPVKRVDFVKYGYEYFDGADYGVGYGGYKYDGRYKASVARMIDFYELQPGARVLEVGCAKGFILHEFYERGMEVSGIDISSYAVDNSMQSVRGSIVQGSCEILPWGDKYFDFVYSKETLPHLTLHQVKATISECIRVCKTNNIFLEIQVSERDIGRELIKAWDETHQCVKDGDWWRNLLCDEGFAGQVNFKQLF